MIESVKIIISLTPVFLFLAALIFLDSYKLVKLRSVLFTIFIGGAVAVICLLLNSWLLELSSSNITAYKRYAAPIIEEFLKAVYLIYLIKTKKVGFLVDAAIYGFAVGAGFALIENIYYLMAVESSDLLLWLVRGCGTAILHGGTMAIMGIISKTLLDCNSTAKIRTFIPGLAGAILIHSTFNHFILSPTLTTIIIMLLLPLIIIIVFERSERATRKWLGIGMDADMKLLEVINTGGISETRIGIYLESLKNRFPGGVVADMLCLLRINLELALRAKGILLMRETGFRVNSIADPEITDKFNELKYLEKSIGKTGKLAILPFLQTSSHDLWQIHMLRK